MASIHIPFAKSKWKKRMILVGAKKKSIPIRQNEFVKKSMLFLITF